MRLCSTLAYVLTSLCFLCYFGTWQLYLKATYNMPSLNHEHKQHAHMVTTNCSPICSLHNFVHKIVEVNGTLGVTKDAMPHQHNKAP